jgi:hypothetical protein
MNRIRKHLNTTLAPAIHDELKSNAKDQGVPVATLIEDAWQFFKGTPTPLTLARRQMLFGDVKPAKKAA